jgi:hypothetical protein
LGPALPVCGNLCWVVSKRATHLQLVVETTLKEGILTIASFFHLKHCAKVKIKMLTIIEINITNLKNIDEHHVATTLNLVLQLIHYTCLMFVMHQIKTKLVLI